MWIKNNKYISTNEENKKDKYYYFLKINFTIQINCRPYKMIDKYIKKGRKQK